MENYSYSSYPDSGQSSPRSREIDCENASWTDDPPSNYKVKFMCSYGGKIHPRPHDNQLTYVGGDTKILAVDRGIRFAAFVSKLSSLCDSEVCFKYQLPGEDLDALISVTNDEDLDHMMVEYDRLYRATAKPARLRLFLFPLSSPTASFASGDSKSERQWFVDALNSVQIQSSIDQGSSPSAEVAAAAAGNPDFLFGFDKAHAPPAAAAAKVEDPPPAPPVREMFQKEINAGSDSGSEDRHVVGDPVVSPAEYQRQVHEFQRFQMASHDQAMFHREAEQTNPRVYTGDFYGQRPPDQLPPMRPAIPATLPANYWPERHVSGAPGTDQPVYLVQTSAGVFQTPAMRPVTMTGQAGQAFYGMPSMQRMVPPEAYREQPVFNPGPPQSMQQTKIGTYPETFGMLRQQQAGQAAEQGYAQVSYDGAGRQVYYTAPGGGVVMSQYATAATAADVRQGGGSVEPRG